MCVEAKAHGGVGYQTRSRLPTASFFSVSPSPPLRPPLSLSLSLSLSLCFSCSFFLSFSLCLFRVPFPLEASSHLGECVTSSNAPRITINYFLVATHLPPLQEACPPCFLRFVLLFLALSADTCVSKSACIYAGKYTPPSQSIFDIFNENFRLPRTTKTTYGRRFSGNPNGIS